MKNKNGMLIIILLITIFLVYGLFSSNYLPENRNIKDAYDDLTSWDFKNDGVVYLAGEWEFFHGRYASEISNKPIKGVISYVPGIWNKIEGREVEKKGYGLGTYRVFLELPKNQMFYLKITNQSTAYNIFVDGELVGSNGFVSKNMDTHVPEFKTQVLCFTTELDKTELIIEISNFSYQKGGFWEPIILGDFESIKKNDVNKIVIDILIIGFLLTTAFIYVNLGLFIKKEKVFIYLAIFLLILSARIFTMGDKLITFFFPGIPWEVLIKLEYLSYYLAIPSFLMFLIRYLSEIKLNNILKFSIIFYLVNSVIVVFFKAKSFTFLLTYNNIFTVFLGLYIIYILFMSIKKKEKGSSRMLIAFLFLIAFVFLEIFSIQQGKWIVNSSVFGVMLFLTIIIFEVNKKFSANVMNTIDNVKLLEKISNVDSLTGLYNRRYIFQKLKEITENNSNVTYSIALFDLDDFKIVNDSFGHQSGDIVLIEVASIFKEYTRGRDIVGRYGGEEFILILFDTELNDAYYVCEKIREKIESEVEARIGITITISGGLAEIEGTSDEAIKKIDDLLYKAKRNGKNRIEKEEKKA